MSGAINWEMLKNQYFSNEVFREELFNMIQSPEGVSFCRDYFVPWQAKFLVPSGGFLFIHVGEKKKCSAIKAKFNINESKCR